MTDAMNIKVSTKEMKGTAEEIEQRKGNLRGLLDNIKNKMNELEQTWTGLAADEIRRKMNAMESRFNEYDTVVASYASFLRRAAEQYEETESTAKKNASAFQ